MSEAKATNPNDILGSFFGGIGRGKSQFSPILICIVLFLLFGQGGKGCGIGNIWAKFDENLILVFVLLLILFGGGGLFKF
ncbi:hypothetical protein [Alkaliphilus metalliredigens]|nr:hypothetical protein [Alkaliphilus metalliredigens]